MSYILDALKKAEAQRVRGAVPGLHSQAVAAMAKGAARSDGSGIQRRWWALGGAAVICACALVWWLWREADREPTPMRSVAPAPANAANIVTPSAAPVVSARVPPSAVPVLPAVPAPVRAGVTAARVTASVSSGARAAVSEARVYQLQELPDDIRRELPRLAISGSVYSGDPANRMLIINGQVFHERDAVAPGLSLAQIRLKAAVLDYKGYRYSISY